MDVSLPTAAQTESLLPVLTVRRWTKVILALAVASVFGVLICLQYGTERIALGDILRFFLRGAQEELGKVLKSWLQISRMQKWLGL